MSSTTAKNLYDACKEDLLEVLETATLYDYGFANHFSDIDTFRCLFGLYQGLRMLEVPHQKLHQALIGGRLEEFIKESYGDRHSGYFKMFLAGRFNLSNPYIKNKK